MKSTATLVFVCTALALAGCASRTRISTEVNATITERQTGRVLGTGTAEYQDRKPVWGSTTFRIEKEGCKSKDLTIYRNDDISPSMFIGGLFLVVPFIWLGDYQPSYGIALDCNRAAGTGH